MITAVDTSVLLDFLLGDARHGRRSLAALRQAVTDGRLIVSVAVWAEVSAAYEDPQIAGEALDRLTVELVPDDRQVAALAGRSWRAYRHAGGSRHRVLTDFLIAAHAQAKADRLLTRDRGFYRSHFRRLAILEP